MSNFISYITTDNLWPYISGIIFIALYAFFAIAEKSEKRASMNLKPAFFTESPLKLKYATKPLRLATDLTEMPITEITKICGLQGWTDGLYIPGNYRKRWVREKKYTGDEIDKKTQQDSEHELLKSIEERLRNPLTSIVICEINEQVGKGVFLALDAKPIPAGTVLGIYSGVFKKNEGKLDYTYALSLSGIVEDSEKKKAPIIDAKDYGNIFRLLQDLPSADELQQVKDLSENQLKRLAVENVQTAGIFYQGYPIMYFKNIVPIEPGDQLGFSYRGGYWNNWINKRKLFDKNAQIIGHFLTEDTVEFYSEEDPLEDNQEDPQADNNSANTNNGELTT